MNLLPFKQPTEQYIHTVDFISLVGSSAVTYANSKVTLIKGSTDDTADIVLTSLASDGAVNLTIRRGTNNQDYAIRILVSDAALNTFEEDLVLLVREIL